MHTNFDPKMREDVQKDMVLKERNTITTKAGTE